MEEIEKKESNGRSDALSLVINTPKDKLAQLTIIPTGGVLAFAAEKTVQQFGKPEFENSDITCMEYLMSTIMEYNRSREGMLISGVLKLAQTELEVKAQEQGEGTSPLYKMS